MRHFRSTVEKQVPAAPSAMTGNPYLTSGGSHAPTFLLSRRRCRPSLGRCISSPTQRVQNGRLVFTPSRTGISLILKRGIAREQVVHRVSGRLRPLTDAVGTVVGLVRTKCRLLAADVGSVGPREGCNQVTARPMPSPSCWQSRPTKSGRKISPSSKDRPSGVSALLAPSLDSSSRV